MSDTPNANTPNVATPAATTDANKWPGAFAAYGKAYDAVKKNIQPALVVVGAYVAVALLNSVIQGKTPADEGYKSSGEAIVGLVFLLAMVVYAFAIADKRVISVKQFMKFNAGKYFTVLFTSILCSIFAVLSLVLFIVPIIWVLPWVYLAIYAAVDKDLSPMAAIKHSKQLTRDHKGEVWGLIGVGFLLTVGSFIFAVVPVVGMFLAYAAIMFVSVVSNGASAMLYRHLEKHNKA